MRRWRRRAQRWPRGWDGATRHAVTMTGEMVDLFADRERGVARLAAAARASALGPSLLLFGRRAAAGVRAAPRPRAHWPRDRLGQLARDAPHLLAARAARRAAGRHRQHDHRPDRRCAAAASPAHGAHDAERLASGELVYQGVVRTPLCALARRVAFGGRDVNVMNEFFATTADVYRLTGELDPAHDQHPRADDGAKDAAATRQRLARMIGRDARDAADADAGSALAQALARRAARRAAGTARARRRRPRGLAPTRRWSAPAAAPSSRARSARRIGPAASTSRCAAGAVRDRRAGATRRAAWVDVCAPARRRSRCWPRGRP